MEPYIKKSDIIAEIEKIQNEFSDSPDRNGNFDDLENQGAHKALDRLEYFLDTLETKEVDLENLFQALPEKIADEKSHQVYELSIYHYDGQCVVDYVGEIDHDSLYTFGGDTLYEAIEKAWNWLYKNSTGG